MPELNGQRDAGADQYAFGNVDKTGSEPKVVSMANLPAYFSHSQCPFAPEETIVASTPESRTIMAFIPFFFKVILLQL